MTIRKGFRIEYYKRKLEIMGNINSLRKQKKEINNVIKGHLEDLRALNLQNMPQLTVKNAFKSLKEGNLRNFKKIDKDEKSKKI